MGGATAIRVGFIGLGVMGRHMAGHVLGAGHQVGLFAPRTIPAELIERGAIPCASPKELAARGVDAVILMVPDTAQVEDALFGPQGLTHALAAGCVVIDMSSISPLATRIFAERIRKLGCSYLDAPVSGGELGAKAASLTIMVGGDSSVFDQMKPLLAAIGKRITLVGDSGAGQIAKLVNQIIVALTIEAVAEALVFASKAGVDVQRVLAAIAGGFASSRVLEVHGERMISRHFDPGFRISLHQKDLHNALTAARSMGVALPATALCQELFNVCTGLGGAAWDHSALVRALEQMSQHQIAGQNECCREPVAG